MNPSPNDAFVGWCRPRGDGPWEPVVTADSWEKCFRLLVSYKPAAVPHCEKIVLPRGEKP